ncbi:hypothetical protein ACPWT1_11755 [Ramlibacter sp. MMS24-I3-19]|uniref:hypothetical protein n=1 Tax=Ramlibacter sp. MMS24-I3-19 TaxID=3416606 RepID=UPI003D0196F2
MYVTSASVPGVPTVRSQARNVRPAVPIVLFQSADGRKRTRVCESAASCIAPLSLTPESVVHVVPPSCENCQVPSPVRPVTAMPPWLPLVSNTWPATMSDTSTPARWAALAQGGGLPPGTLPVHLKSS